ncbi:MAG: hypothetical protein P8176_02520 [Gammaproteobacteria bacterium]
MEEIEAEDELSEEGGADGEMLLEDGDDYIGENSFGGGSSGDSGQGRSRGEYVAPEDSEEKAGNVEQKSKKSHVGVSGQTGADLREQIESQREQIESQDEAAADARARRDDSVESYLAEREELAQQERVQEHLTAIEQFQNNLQGLSQFAGQQGFMGSLAFVGFGGGFFGGVAPIPTMDRRGLIVEKPKEKENTKGVGKSQSKKSLDSAEHADSKDELQEDESESQLRGAEKALTHEDLVAVRREAFQERFGQWLAARDEEIGDEDDQQFIAQMLLEYHQYALQDDDGEAYRRCLWLTALELMPPANLSALCETAVGGVLPALRGALARCARKMRILSQNRMGQLQFVKGVEEPIRDVSNRLLSENPYHRQATSSQEAFALMAKRLALPVVVVEYDGVQYTLRTPHSAPDQMWCVLQVWDIDWTRQRVVVLMEGDRFTFLRRDF